MAKSKRLALSVPIEADILLSRLSAATNTPKSQIIADLILEAIPVFQQVMDSIDQVKAGQQKAAIDALADYLGKATLNLNQAHLDLGEMKGKLYGKP